MSALFTSIVIPILGTMAYMASNPGKSSRGDPNQDKPIWSTWVENLVKAFVVRRSEDDIRPNQREVPSDPESGGGKEGGAPHSQPMAQPIPLAARFPFPAGAIPMKAQQDFIDLAASRRLPQGLLQQLDANSKADPMSMLEYFLGRTTVSSPPPINLEQVNPHDLGMLEDFGSRPVLDDPSLTEPRRLQASPANESRPRQQQYGNTSSPIQRRGFGKDTQDRYGPSPKGFVPDHSESRGEPSDPNGPRSGGPKYYSERSSQGGGQAAQYLSGDYHSENRDDRKRHSPDQLHGRSDLRSKRGENYRDDNQPYGYDSGDVSRDPRYSGRRRDRRDRSTGRRGRPLYREEEEEEESPRGQQNNRYWIGDYDPEEYEANADPRRPSRKERQRRRGSHTRPEEEDPEARHQGHSPRRSHDGDHTQGNHNNISVNVVLPTSSPALAVTEVPRPGTPPATDNFPNVQEAVAPIIEKVTDTHVVGNEEVKQLSVERRKKGTEQFQLAMRGPPEKQDKPSALIQSPDLVPVQRGADVRPAETTEHDASESISAGTGTVNPHEQRTAEPIPVRTPGPDNAVYAEPQLPDAPPDPHRPSNTPRHLPLRGLGAKRKPLESIKTQNQNTTAVEGSPDAPSDTDGTSNSDHRNSKSLEASPKALRTGDMQDSVTSNRSSRLTQSDTTISPTRGRTSQHNKRSPSISSAPYHPHHETPKMTSVRDPPSSPASQSEQVRDDSSDDDVSHRIDDPEKTVADEIFATRPQRFRQRQRVAREVLAHSSTLKTHNVRGPKSLARLIKLALKSSPKMTLLMVIVLVTYLSGIIYFGNQITVLEQLTSATIQRRAPEDEIATSSWLSPLESFEKDTQLLIILTLWHAGIWLILLFLIDYIWRGIPDPNQGQKHQLWFDRLGFKSLVRVMLTFAPIIVYLILGGRQLTSCAFLLNDPNAIAWSMWPDVALTWPQLSDAAITKAKAPSAGDFMTDDVDAWQLLAVSAFFWATGIPTFLYSVRRIRHPGTRSRRRLISRIQKGTMV